MSAEIYSVKRHGTTVTECDREPIHTPGCIQPHGVLLVLRPDDLLIRQVSENAAQWLGTPPEALVGAPVGLALGDVAEVRLRRFLASEPTLENPLYAFSIRTEAAPAPLDVSVHTLEDGEILVEVEATARDTARALDDYALVKRATARMQGATTLAGFCAVLAEEIRAFTGLDRVMVYRFHPDGSGEVFADAHDAALSSWLGQRYPADDIPEPARAIFRKTHLRPLPNARAEMMEMVPLAHPDTGRPVDMTFCALRGASVMYTEYLQNMGVAASLTASLMCEGELWGLVTGHHLTPTSFSYQVRAATELVTRIASLQLRNAEDREHLAYRARIDAVHDAALERAASEGGLPGLVRGQPALGEGIRSGGVGLLHRGQWWTAGETPSGPLLEALPSFVRQRVDARSSRPAVAVEALGAELSVARPYAEIASGVLAVPLATDGQDLLVWFRPEQVRTVVWGGNPHDKPTVMGPNGPRLTPRASFERWCETVRGRSEPWKRVEVDAALRLRTLVMDLVVSHAEQLAELNADLARSNAELDAFAYVASHDLKEPLRGIHKYAHHLLEEARAAQGLGALAEERLQTLLRLTVRMDGLLDALLHFSRVGRLELACEPIPFSEIVREAVEMLGARMLDEDVEIRILEPMPTITCDRVQVREVLSNLLGNAIKYNEAVQKRVEVGCLDVPPPSAPAEVAGQRTFFVRDNGIGIAPKHQQQIFRMFKRLHGRAAFGGGAGAGLAIASKLVERHGGKMWLESTPGEGTTFHFTLGPEAAR